MPNPPLEQAVEQVRAGNLEEARKALELIIREDRSNISAWQWYAETWPKPKDKIRVWELCLRYNPMNPQAEQALSLLRPASSRFSKVLLWVSVGMFVIVAPLVIVVVKAISPLDPAEYLHTQPVEYYLYVPKEYSGEQDWPLFVGIHGAGGTGLDCWNLWQQYADKEGFILLCPSIPGDASGFYQDVGEQTVWSAVGEVQKEYRVHPRMFLSGFSAGAFFIQGFFMHYPSSVSGLSILSAGLYLNPHQFAQLVPVLIVIGGQDDPFALQSSLIFAAELQRGGFDAKYVALPEAGHWITEEGLDLTIELFRKTVGTRLNDLELK